MFLKRITLENFRQFYGKQEINFSTDRQKKVTLIHAENGVGKTTLLNALLWCFYKDLTKRFENPEKIVSNQALEEKNYNASVEILFEHAGSEYLVLRSISEETKQENFEASRISDGNYEPLPNPTVFIDSVIPREMSRYFFFDGEYAETFSSNKNKAVVQKAVESMLGCNIATQAEADLKALKNATEKDIAALTKNNQSEVFQKRIDILEAENEKDQERIISLSQNLEAAKESIQIILEGLRNSSATKEIQSNRDNLTMQKNNAEKTKLNHEANRIKWINENSFGLLSTKTNAICSDIISSANIKGQIPSKIAENFVNDILEEKKCICGRHFDNGSCEEKAIKSLMSEAGTAIMGDRLMNIRSLMGELEKSNKQAIDEYYNLTNQIEKLNNVIDECEAKIQECSKQLQSSDIREIAEREQAYEAKSEEIGGLTAQIARLKKGCEQRDNEINEARLKRDKSLNHDERAKGLQKRIKLLDATLLKLDIELNQYREESRKIIINKVNKILLETARRDYTAKIDKDFNLDMYSNKGTTAVAKSSGENQLLSLAFIASLVSFAADRREEERQLLKPGTMAPLMLDSPFGQLDPSYRRSTAKFLPALTEQVVLLVSKTQGDDDVITALGETIGAEYVLISEVKDVQNDKPSDIIFLHGEEIACSLYECAKNKTTIRKVA